jgi:site-specific DNA-adenine methylase
MNKRCKTPLRWVGGKSRALTKLQVHNPQNMDNIIEIRDAFLGGGSYPLYLSQLYPDKAIWVNDVYYPLYNFWIQLRDNSEQLISKLIKKKEDNDTPEKCKVLFQCSKNIMNHGGYANIDKAVAFYIVNKCSFSGLTENGSFSEGASKNNFKVNLINDLSIYSSIIQRWRITNLDYKELMNGDGHVFLYLDPPYDIKSNIYGKKGDLHKVFDHEEFKNECLTCKCRILISYNIEIDGLSNHHFDLTYTMKSDKKYIEGQKKRQEVAITNYFDYYDTDEEEISGYIRGA